MSLLRPVWVWEKKKGDAAENQILLVSCSSETLSNLGVRFQYLSIKADLFSIEIALRFLISLNKHNAFPCQIDPIQL